MVQNRLLGTPRRQRVSTLQTTLWVTMTTSPPAIESAAESPFVTRLRTPARLSAPLDPELLRSGLPGFIFPGKERPGFVYGEALPRRRRAMSVNSSMEVIGQPRAALIGAAVSRARIRGLEKMRDISFSAK